MRQSKRHYAILFGISLALITFFLIFNIPTGSNSRDGFLPIRRTTNTKVILAPPPAQVTQSGKKSSSATDKAPRNIQNEDNPEIKFAYLKEKIGKK